MRAEKRACKDDVKQKSKPVELSVEINTLARERENAVEGLTIGWDTQRERRILALAHHTRIEPEVENDVENLSLVEPQATHSLN